MTSVYLKYKNDKNCFNTFLTIILILPVVSGVTKGGDEGSANVTLKKILDTVSLVINGDHFISIKKLPEDEKLIKLKMNPLSKEKIKSFGLPGQITNTICRSYIPFAFGISQELTATQFANLKSFLVNYFFKYIFSKDIEPALYLTYDTTYFDFKRSITFSDVINDIQNVQQTNVATSDFNL